LFLRDRDKLLGFGRIAEIRTVEATKTILRCPVCRTSQIYRRQDLHPAFYCSKHKAIEEPIQEVISVRGYEADYSRTYAAVPRSRGSPTSTPFHGADGADALQGIGQQWPFVRRKDGRWIGGLLRIGKRQKSDRTTGGPPVKDEMVSIMGRAIPGVGKQFKAETRRPDYIVGTSSLLSVYCVARSKSGIQNAFYRFVTLEIIENRP